VKTEATWVAGAARKLRPRPGQPAVRMPGDTANALRARQRRDGIALHPTIMPELAKWAQKLSVELPQPLA
jgi:LDH2 family malate/lactate/ureidoglycolate dehydrogenase